MSKKQRSRRPRALLVLSDTHCGGDTALAPPSFRLKAGNVIDFGSNRHQEFLWAGWTETAAWAERLLGSDPYAILVNGDAIEGDHHRTKELVAQRESDQVKMAVECLRVFRTPECLYIARGTECHTQGLEDDLAAALGAEGGKARNLWLLEIAGCLVEAKHHMPTASKKWSEASQLSSCMSNAAVNYGFAGLAIPKVYLRAHRHCHGWYSNGGAAIGVTGGWQFLTRFGHKAVPDSIPCPSALLLDWRDCEDGALPMVYEKVITPRQTEYPIVRI